MNKRGKMNEMHVKAQEKGGWGIKEKGEPGGGTHKEGEKKGGGEVRPNTKKNSASG